jgi:hypothetical protein
LLKGIIDFFKRNAVNIEPVKFTIYAEKKEIVEE